MTAKIEDIRQTGSNDPSRTIFHEILRSDIAPEQKTTARLADEAMVITIAGADTTAPTLVALSYNVLSDPSIFARLRTELETAIPDPNQAPDPKALDGLPFLNALIEETLCLHPTGTHHQDRLAPDESSSRTQMGRNSPSPPEQSSVGWRLS